MLTNFKLWHANREIAINTKYRHANRAIAINTKYIISIERLGHMPPCCRVVVEGGREYEIRGTAEELLKLAERTMTEQARQRAMEELAEIGQEQEQAEAETK